MIDEQNTGEFAFLSYSHDSPEHKDRVRSLAEKLIGAGFPAVLDQWQPFPPEGWPRWMLRQIQAARFVLIIATEPYYRRAVGLEVPGAGHGAIWESQIITQQLYESAGHNEKFIPIVLDATDVRFIPAFLAPYTRFNIATEDGFVALLRLLTNQPEHEAPPLGPRIYLPPTKTQATSAAPQKATTTLVTSSGDAVLLHPLNDGLIGARSERIEEGPDDVRLTLVIDDDRSVMALRHVEPRSSIGIAYANTAFMGDIRDVRIVREGGVVRCHLTVSPSRSDYGVSMEPSFNETSADEIASMRARRILLDEPGPHADTGAFTTHQLNAQTLELFVGGMNTPIRIRKSPLPVIFDASVAAADPERFLMELRVLAILFLRLSGATETVEKLDLGLTEGRLEVDFIGQRSKKYANRDPVTITVRGVIDLPARKSALALEAEAK